MKKVTSTFRNLKNPLIYTHSTPLLISISRIILQSNFTKNHPNPTFTHTISTLIQDQKLQFLTLQPHPHPLFTTTKTPPQTHKSGITWSIFRIFTLFDRRTQTNIYSQIPWQKSTLFLNFARFLEARPVTSPLTNLTHF